MYISDLKFPLIDYLRDIPRSEFAKKKLLTGEVSIEMPNNKCNSFSYVNGKCLIKAPKFQMINRTHVVFTCDMRHRNFDKLTHVSGLLYKIKNTRYYFIVKDNTILCIMSIKSISGADKIDFKETDDFYRLVFETGYSVNFSKKDLSYEVRWC